MERKSKLQNLEAFLCRNTVSRVYKRKNQGFTFLELVIVLTVLALLAGVLVEPVTQVVTQTKEEDTKKNMDKIGQAVEMYYEDLVDFPSNLSDLYVNPGLAGWNGPYILPRNSQANDPTSNTVVYDLFRTAYSFQKVNSTVAILTSAGPDRTFNTSDDIQKVLDMKLSSRLRELTIEEIRVANLAILRYIQERGNNPPLPAGNWPTALSILQTWGYLPLGTTYLKDSFGTVYSFDGQKISSPNL